MRKALIPHLNHLVLCKGWIDSWEDFEGTNTRRVCVKQATIKIADKNTLFSNQQLVSTEHHINLFIPHQHLGEYEAHFIRHAPISFSGVVVEYQRKDGSVDYGIKATPQQRIRLDLERLYLAVRGITRAAPFTPTTLAFYEHTALPQVLVLEERLERAGNALPTFENTYMEFKQMLNGLRDIVEYETNRTSNFIGSREYRRMIKGKKSLLMELRHM